MLQQHARQKKLKQKRVKKKKFFSPLFQESDRHTESTRDGKKSRTKKNKSLM